MARARAALWRRGSVLTLLLIACLGLAACQNEAQKQAAAKELERQRQNEAHLKDYETQRTRLAAQLADTKAKAAARIARDPGAAAALLAAGGGTALALDEQLTDDQRAASGFVGVVGATYCLFNFNECASLTADIAEFTSTEDRLEKEIAALSETAGYRVLVDNSCGKPVRVALEINDPIDGPRKAGWWTIKANMRATLPMEFWSHNQDRRSSDPL